METYCLSTCKFREKLKTVCVRIGLRVERSRDSFDPPNFASVAICGLLYSLDQANKNSPPSSRNSVVKSPFVTPELRGQIDPLALSERFAAIQINASMVFYQPYHFFSPSTKVKCSGFFF